MSTSETLTRILESGIVAVIRMTDTGRLLRVVEAIQTGGVNLIEITMTVPDALAMIRRVTDEASQDVVVGVGSVINRNMAEDAVEAGARYVVSPVFKPEVVDACKALGVPVMQGAFTPTEALAAHEAGADIVKVFPADVLGMAFLKGVLAPMPFLRLLPTGGVTLDNAGDWVRAGAVGVGVGGALLDSKAIASDRFDVITDNARRLRASYEEGRRDMTT
jgi:2-dehydro-3-deoxyphosphogluconate aldolase / (4S)-4-hydroxy-2-oxoglutarate aldolase